MYIHYVYDPTWTLKSTETQTGKGDDKRIRLCFETGDLHQDCPGIHEKYSIIIELLPFNLKRIIIHFRYGFCQALSDAFPWSHPSSQSSKTFLRSALTSIIFIYWLTWLQVSSLVCNLPLLCNFIQCNRFFQKIFFDLNVGFGANPWSEKTRVSSLRVQKRVKDLVIENLKGKWDVSQPFLFYSRAAWIFVHVIRTQAVSFAHIELRVKPG